MMTENMQMSFIFIFCHIIFWDAGNVKAALRCSPGWILSSTQTYCYYFAGSTSYNWSTAITKCQNLGGQLPIFPNQAEQNAYTNITSAAAYSSYSFFFLGLVKNGTQWLWTDNTLPSYTAWYPGEPTGDGNCGSVYAHINSEWNDLSCSGNYQFFCQATPLNCTGPEDGYKYTISNNQYGCYLNVQNGYSTVGESLILYPSGHNFYTIYAPNTTNSFMFIVDFDNLALDSTFNLTQQVAMCNATQQFIFANGPQCTYYIYANSNASNMVLSGQGSMSGCPSNVQPPIAIKPFTGAIYQQWNFYQINSSGVVTRPACSIDTTTSTTITTTTTSTITPTVTSTSSAANTTSTTVLPVTSTSTTTTTTTATTPPVTSGSTAIATAMTETNIPLLTAPIVVLPQILQDLGVSTDILDDPISLTTTLQDVGPFVVATLNDSMRQQLGQQLSDMIRICTYNEQDCSNQSNFQYLYNPTYGNCYTFNFGVTAKYYVADVGPNYGLRILLHASQNDYACASPTAGFRIAFQHNNLPVYPELSGYDIPPGAASWITLDQSITTLLGKPHETCADDTYGVNYTVQDCLKRCLQTYLIQQCQCSDPRYPSVSNSTICPPEKMGCLDYSTQCLFDSSIKNCNCPQPCREVQFYPTITFVQLKSVDIYKNTYCRDDVNIPLCESTFDQNFAILYIYYRSLQTVVYEEVATYGITNVLSDMSNVTGLLLGICVITIPEIICFFFSVITLCCKRSAK